MAAVTPYPTSINKVNQTSIRLASGPSATPGMTMTSNMNSLQKLAENDTSLKKGKGYKFV